MFLTFAHVLDVNGLQVVWFAGELVQGYGVRFLSTKVLGGWLRSCQMQGILPCKLYFFKECITRTVTKFDVRCIGHFRPQVRVWIISSWRSTGQSSPPFCYLNELPKITLLCCAKRGKGAILDHKQTCNLPWCELKLSVASQFPASFFTSSVLSILRSWSDSRREAAPKVVGRWVCEYFQNGSSARSSGSFRKRASFLLALLLLVMLAFMVMSYLD